MLQFLYLQILKPTDGFTLLLSTQDRVFVAKAFHPPSGRVMEVYSNQPGVQFYTGNYMPEDDTSQGKGAAYRKHGAFCFETQNYPDAIHHVSQKLH